MLHYRIRREDGDEIPVWGRGELTDRLYAEIGTYLDSDGRCSEKTFKNRMWNCSDEQASNDFKDYIDVTVEYKVKPR